MKLFRYLLAAILVPAALFGSSGAEEESPNLIVIFTDDHGYADLSCVGTEPDVKTPHLDRLAAEGVRFKFGENGMGPLPAKEVTSAPFVSLLTEHQVLPEADLRKLLSVLPGVTDPEVIAPLPGFGFSRGIIPPAPARRASGPQGGGGRA